MSLFKSMVVGLVLCSLTVPAHASKLDDVREELSKPSVSPKSSPPSFSYSSNQNHNENWFEDLVYTAVLIASPFVIPYTLCEDGRWKSEPGFLDWPYEGGAPGYGTDQLDEQRYWDGFAGRLQLGAGYASWGYRFAGDLRISLDSRLDLNFSGSALAEPNDAGKLDLISFYEPGVSWLFALGDRAQFRLGADLVLLVDAGKDPIPGFTVNYSIDWFPVDPLVFTLEFAAGYLDDKFYGHTDVTMGVALGPVEPFIGYEARSIGEQYVGTASAGLRIWF